MLKGTHDHIEIRAFSPNLLSANGVKKMGVTAVSSERVKMRGKTKGLP